MAICTVIALIVLGLGAALQELGLPLQVKGTKYRALSLLAITPIAVSCGAAVGYFYSALPVWASVALTVLTLAGGVAAAIFVVSLILPSKISTREGP